MSFTNLPRSLYVTLLVVKEYLEDTGLDYVTYNKLKGYCYRKRLYYKYRINDRTLDRSLRELARLGYFERKYLRNGKKVIYKPKPLFYAFLDWHNRFVTRNSEARQSRNVQGRTRAGRENG